MLYRGISHYITREHQASSLEYENLKAEDRKIVCTELVPVAQAMLDRLVLGDAPEIVCFDYQIHQRQGPVLTELCTALARELEAHGYVDRKDGAVMTLDLSRNKERRTVLN